MNQNRLQHPSSKRKAAINKEKCMPLLTATRFEVLLHEPARADRRCHRIGHRRYWRTLHGRWRTPVGWLALYEHLGTGDGDAWWELWLHAAPSTQALGAATASRSGQGARA